MLYPFKDNESYNQISANGFQTLISELLAIDHKSIIRIIQKMLSKVERYDFNDKAGNYGKIVKIYESMFYKLNRTEADKHINIRMICVS